jgi:hypothetical protein
MGHINKDPVPRMPAPAHFNLIAPEAQPQGEIRGLRRLASVTSSNVVFASDDEILAPRSDKKRDALFSRSACSEIEPKGTCNTESETAKELYACCDSSLCIAPLGIRFVCKPGITNACCPLKSLVTIVRSPGASD